MERLQADTFACNRIHLLYPETSWRPTYYSRFEPPQWDKSPAEFFDECRIHINLGEQCIFPSAWLPELGDHPNIEWKNSCHHYKYSHLHRKFPKSFHLPMLCDINAVTINIQLAILKGYEMIYLLGCDIVGQHFSPEDNGAVQTERLIRAHEIARQTSPIPIYNATLGGALEVYPRVNLEEIL